MNKKGEIATTLSIIALIIVSIGALIGARKTMQQQRLPDASAQFDPPLAEINVARHGRLTVQKGSYSVVNGVPTFLLEGSFSAGNTINPGYREIITITDSQNITSGYGGIKRTYMFPSEKRDFQMSFFARKDYTCSSTPINIIVKGPSQNQVGELIVDLQKICEAMIPTVSPTSIPTAAPTSVPTNLPLIPINTPIYTVAPTVKPTTRPARPTAVPIPTIDPRPSAGRIKVTAHDSEPMDGASRSITFYLFEYDTLTNSAANSALRTEEVYEGIKTPDGFGVILEHTFENLKPNKNYVVFASRLFSPGFPNHGMHEWSVRPPSTRCLHPINAPVTNQGTKTSPEDYCIVKATASGLPGQDFGQEIRVTGELRIEGKPGHIVQGSYEFWPRMYTTQYDYESTGLQKDLSYTNFIIPKSDNIRGLFTHVLDSSRDGKLESVVSVDFSRNERVYEGDGISIGMHYLDYADSNKSPIVMSVTAQNHVCKKPDFGGPYCTFTIPKGGLHLKFKTNNAIPIPTISNFLPSRGTGRVVGTIMLQGACSNSQPAKSKVTVQLYKEFFDKAKQKYPSRYDIVDRTIVLNDASAVTVGTNCKYSYEIANLESNATYAVGVKVQKDIPVGIKLPVQDQTETISPAVGCAHPFIPASFHEVSEKFCKFTAKEMAPVIDFGQ